MAKYEEANLMHKKMMAVSQRLAEFEKSGTGHKKKLNIARDRLYAGQCNCPYWHGVFGGLYLPHIRQAIYANLVEAESILIELSGQKENQIHISDFDADGHDEIRVSSPDLTAVFKPSRGGTLVELSINKLAFSITDTLTRRKEGYHLKLDEAVAPGESAKTSSIHDLVLAKEKGLKELLIEDWYLKRCFIDHFFNGQVDFEAFRSGEFREDGDFVLEAYQYTLDEQSGDLILSRDGHLWKPDGLIELRLLKRFGFDAGSGRVRVTYEISSPKGEPVEVVFGIENNFNLQAGHAPDRYVLIDHERPGDSYLDTSAVHTDVRSFAVADEARNIGLAFESDRPAEIWQLPIFTVSLSEGGFEKVYQGTTFVNCYRLKLSEEPTELSLALLTGSLSDVRQAMRSISTVSR
ncbi:MAG: DUF1926 domain-containing protein [Candidatus Zixiibacteriota bacterium]|nr:MAG: DUF1926 domain-containing protein [candidate division Zixibacteria bacterium]